MKNINKKKYSDLGFFNSFRTSFPLFLSLIILGASLLALEMYSKEQVSVAHAQSESKVIDYTDFSDPRRSVSSYTPVGRFHDCIPDVLASDVLPIDSPRRIYDGDLSEIAAAYSCVWWGKSVYECALEYKCLVSRTNLNTPKRCYKRFRELYEIRKDARTMVNGKKIPLADLCKAKGSPPCGKPPKPEDDPCYGVNVSNSKPSSADPSAATQEQQGQSTGTSAGFDFLDPE